MRFSKDHMWVKYECETKKATCGITFFSQKEIGDILDYHLPAEGKDCIPKQKIGQIESFSKLFSLYSPLEMKVLAVDLLGKSGFERRASKR